VAGFTNVACDPELSGWGLYLLTCNSKACAMPLCFVISYASR